MNQETLQWEFVGECGLDEESRPPADKVEYVYRLNLGIAFLRLVFGDPPDGCVFDVLWAEYQNIRFPIIALGFEDLPEGLDDYVECLRQALETFDQAVDWDKITLATFKTYDSI